MLNIFLTKILYSNQYQQSQIIFIYFFIISKKINLFFIIFILEIENNIIIQKTNIIYRFFQINQIKKIQQLHISIKYVHNTSQLSYLSILIKIQLFIQTLINNINIRLIIKKRLWTK
ncbi:hypothetical protein PPERSA_07434 [Pseudocohnilembus persalinus]|uniref:Transmembrane protein n=1 Tax=Pseudocohnilembus persalinus TaxID=266149 RepID=A0A0V0QAU9_PSEPJ|nr:hypothetical protein PPERSA_07434 [Pseudocohnilembus persalinus]|eukprot:KRW99191.1 hypothetical protein PPERSA_07434 [Pseudocohnilembus persalinus]